MAIYLLPTERASPKLHTVDMDWPPPPPSPLDDIERIKRRVQHRGRILQLLKEKFPGLPY